VFYLVPPTLPSHPELQHYYHHFSKIFELQQNVQYHGIKDRTGFIELIYQDEVDQQQKAHIYLVDLD